MLRLVFMAHKLDRFDEIGGRRQNAIYHQLWQQISNSNGEAHRPPTGAAFQDIRHFLAKGKDFVGVSINNTAEFSKNQISPLAREELLTQGLFKGADLSADRGLCQQENLTRAGDAPFPGNRPEVQQVMIINPFHAEVLLVSNAHIYNTITYEKARSSTHGWPAEMGEAEYETDADHATMKVPEIAGFENPIF
jgi:hypothetical protein